MTDADLHDLTGTMKSLLREMVPPLLTYAHYNALIEAVASPDETDHFPKLSQVLAAFPDKNFSKTYYLILHLQRYV